MGNVSQIPATVLRENALRKAPWSMGQTAGLAGDVTQVPLDSSGMPVITDNASPPQAVTQSTTLNELEFSGNITLSANPKRNYLFVQNQGGGVMFFSTIKTGTLTSGGQIPANGTWEPNVCPDNQISFTGTGFLMEGVSE